VQSLSEITEWATQNFRQDFETLPDAAGLTFEPLDKTKALKLYSTGQYCAAWLEKASPQLLRVGHFYKNPNLSPDACVAFAYIRFSTPYGGESTLGAHYLYKNSSGSYVDLAAVRHIHLEAPFDKMTNSNGAPDWSLMKALVCWYFVAMGYLDNIGNYRLFKTKFESACALVRKGSRNPVPTPKKSMMATESHYCREGLSDLPDRGTGDLEGSHGIHRTWYLFCLSQLNMN
jgi:hypothetical protein